MPIEEKSRYGIDGYDVTHLRYQWGKVNIDGDWANFDAFVAWCSGHGYEYGKLLVRKNTNLPHGPSNSWWATKADLLRIKREAEAKKAAPNEPCEFCRGCTKECAHNGSGCDTWRKWFIENWNKNIHSVKSEEGTGRPVFRYAHPDAIREGLA